MEETERVNGKPPNEETVQQNVHNIHKSESLKCTSSTKSKRIREKRDDYTMAVKMDISQIQECSNNISKPLI